MIKKDLISRTAELSDESEYLTKQIIENALCAMTEALLNGEEIQLRGFGTFAVVGRRPKLVRDINTGIEYWTAPRNVVVFKPGKTFEKL